jgi:hypothetical protein
MTLCDGFLGKPRIIAFGCIRPRPTARISGITGGKMTPLQHHLFVAAMLHAARALKKGNRK